MNRLFCTALLLVGCTMTHTVRAQFYAGLVTGNHAGIVGATDNPAYIANNYYDLDVAILGINLYGETNYAKVIRDRAFLNFNFNDVSTGFIRNGKVKYGTLKAEILLPSAMMNYKDGWSFGLSNRFRTYANMAQLSPDFANLMADGFENSDYFGSSYSNENMFWYGQGWIEIGGVVAKQIELPHGRLKLGGTVKYLMGYGAFHVQMKDLDVTPDTSKEVLLTNINMNLGYSDNLDYSDQSYTFQKSSLGLNLGLDLGFIYEHDPKVIRNAGHPHAVDKNYFKKWQIPYYKYRLSVAIKDIGGIKYNMGISGAQVTEVIDPLQPINIDDIQSSIKGPQDVLPTLNNYFITQPVSGQYTMGLPTTLVTSLDYNLNNGRYINVHTTFSLRKKTGEKTPVQELNTIVVTPRWENPKFGVYLPIYHQFGNVTNVGLAGRAGPVTLGLHNIAPFLFDKEFSSAGVFIVFKTTFPPKSGIQCKVPKWKRGKTKKKNKPQLIDNHTPQLEEKNRKRKKNLKRG